MRVFSFGGGVQSTAALVLAAQGKIDYRVFLFSNVGDDSENPDTLDYVKSVSVPFSQKNGLALHELRRETNNGETLYQRTLRETSGVRIPVRMKNGMPGRRSCTQGFKIDVIRRWLGKGTHTVGLGISWDEVHRMRDSGNARFINEYPLIELRMTRAVCLEIVRAAGLPQPPKSACWFCPFHRKSEWADMRRDKPELFERAVELEKILTAKRAALGRDAVFMAAGGVSLSVAIGDQPRLIEDDACDSGYCFS